jgi:CheY-like chemotaxis protein
MSIRPAHFLFIDDDLVEIDGMKRAFKKAKIANPIHTASDGLVALEALRGSHGRPAVPRPLIVLLDLRMPRMDGIEFLKEVRADQRLRDSVIFVLTTSNAAADVAAAYQYNVAGYITKRRFSSEFERAMAMLDSYWRIVELPQ